VANAQILLTIDDTTPSHTVITATGNFDAASGSASLGDGIDLLSFFTSQDLADAVVANPSTLTTGDSSSGPLFTYGFEDNISLAGYVDLNLYQLGSGATITFTSGQSAFAGSLTLNLSGVSGLLPAVGSTGTIVTGFSGDAPNNTVIGEYEVVPEPTTGAMLVVCFGTLIFLGRGLRRASR
jgi:hypothetical protein